LSYLGLFASPLLLLTRFTEERQLGFQRWFPIIISTTLLCLTIARLIYLRSFLPISSNILIPQGLGPLTLRDTFLLKHQDIPPLPWMFWAVVTVLALYGQFELVKRAISYLVVILGRLQNISLTKSDRGPLMALATTAIYCGPIILIRIFDRYMTPLLPLVFFWIIATAKPNLRGVLVPAAAVLIVCGTIVFAVLGTHDYLAWNRARWAAIAELERSHQADDQTLDGGFEYNGLRAYDAAYIPPVDKSMWWVKDDEYMISFGPIEGYLSVARYPYTSFLPPDTRAILVLHRQPVSK
jgi:hypothetical protein